ncbi:hypothetical protein LTS18_009251 [Coniosporium uncinatum]|uniref:Uncharacterized protein n=1 Tax=Coniosporium uncinatum TaxID=93489 RepID=A0ACC3DD94_9PEZI|nr:hypothetical protein LTS18_009251 [Coniosporium uncinatum]
MDDIPPVPPATGVSRSNGNPRQSESLERLSINNAPPDGDKTQAQTQHRDNTSPSISRTQTSNLRRSSSSFGLDHKASLPSPSLTRRTSTTSLRGADVPITPKKLSSRRSSANLQSSPTINPRSPLAPSMEEEEEKPPMTAATVAAAHFEKELALHERSASQSNTLVVLHDACYGHRFSRPKTTKATLSMIVERPERIHAGILGISTAYVRLGERHVGGRAPPHPYREPVQDMPFRIKRTSRVIPLTSPAVTSVHGTDWMKELGTMCDAAGQKLAKGRKELSRPDNGTSKEELHSGDLYLCPQSQDAFQGALGGVFDGVDAVFENSRNAQGPSQAFVCIRPPGHHCSADYPSGFCWINNVHVGIEYAAQTHGLTHAAIIDFDLHHGDGSQQIAWDHNSRVAKLPKNAPASRKTSIGYFSLHDINSYPCEYGDDEKVQKASLCVESAHGQTIWNVHLQPWKTEDEFWQLYESKYIVLVEKARTFLKTHTQRLRAASNAPPARSAIFLSAGFDASEWESQGMQRHKVNVPTAFYARLTQDIVKLAQEEGTGVDGRIISVLEGGYSDRALMSGVLSHLSGLCDGQKVHVNKEACTENGLGYEMASRLNGLTLNERPQATIKTSQLHYNPEWWHSLSLTELETRAGVAPPVVAKKTKTGPAANFQTPTQSFTAKVVDPSKLYRSISGNYKSSPSRQPTLPPPDVDWVTAAHELCKLLIPTDRQTRSCRPEELAESRAKENRQSTSTLPTETVAVPAGGRQLRDRRSKVPNYAELNDVAPNVRASSRSDRRRTIADLPSASTEPIDENVGPRKTSRRLSMASNISENSSVAPMDRAPSVPAVAIRTAAPLKPVNGVQSKKTRSSGPTSTARSRPQSVASCVRPPVPRVPSGYAAPLRATAGASSNTAQGVSTASNGATASGIDELTTATRKLKINMPSDEEYLSREQKRAVEAAEKQKAEKAAKASARRVPVTRGARAPSVGGRKPAAKDIKHAVPAPTPQATVTADVPVVAPQPTGPIEIPPGNTMTALDANHPTLREQLHVLVPPPLTQKMSDSATSTTSNTTEVYPTLQQSSPFAQASPPPVAIEIASDIPVPDVAIPTASPPRPDTPPAPPPMGPYPISAYGPATMHPPLRLPIDSIPSRNKSSSHPYLSAEQWPQQRDGTKPSTFTQNTQADYASHVQEDTAQHAKQAPLSATDPRLQSTDVASARPMPRGQLPVFTASGKIPFAIPQGQKPSNSEALRAAPAEVTKTGNSVDMWEVPETPQK